MTERKLNLRCAGCGKWTRGRDDARTPRCNACKGVVRLIWADVLERAARIVRSYLTGMTLRQLFYRLVAIGLLPNLRTQYAHLGENTAEARREGWFPGLIDRTSRIERYETFTGPDDARDYLREIYRRDRTEGQPWTIVLGVEKAGMSEQLDAWFTEPYGIPHVALGGYASQTLCDEVRRYVESQGRPAVLIYAGDHDPTGEDIDRDFVDRTGCWDEVIRVALSREQAAGLPGSIDAPEALTPEVERKLLRDPRAKAFLARHGSLAQVEVDALEPARLRNLFRRAVEIHWSDDAYRAVMQREAADRAELEGDGR